MTETADQTKSPEATPEQLMQLLDLQIALQKTRRKAGQKHRVTLLVGSVLLILAGLFVALMILQEMAGDLRSQQTFGMNPAAEEQSQ